MNYLLAAHSAARDDDAEHYYPADTGDKHVFDGSICWCLPSYHLTKDGWMVTHWDGCEKAGETVH